MPTLVQHDYARDQLHLIFDRDSLIATTKWIAPNATIDLANNGEPVAINVFFYYTKKEWPLTEESVQLWGLEKHVDDLRLVWQNFFAPPGFAVKAIKYEGPDGNEVILPVTD